MSLSRRAFVRTIGRRGPPTLLGALVAARGLEALQAKGWPEGADAAQIAPPDAQEIRISSNENPLGPSPAALDAVMAQFGDAGRYPNNSRPAAADLKTLLAKRYRITPENVTLGAGSGEILENAVRAFAGPDRALVTAAPSYEAPERMAQQLKVPVRAIPVDAGGRLDLHAMAEAARGAGLLFVCNPNNPTATVHGSKAIAELIGRVRRSSPDTTILIDEAYHDYVTDPGYATAIPLATNRPKVIVSRTFSKAHGMAGLRIGYAIGHRETIAALGKYAMPYNANVLGTAAAYASFQDNAHLSRERARNAQVRVFTVGFFEAGGYQVTDSQANFIFVDLRRLAKEFREACQRYGVIIGRDFPPLDKTHARISIGTMDEMRRATEVFRKVLDVSITSAKGN